jgi:hypothetical protein
MWTGNVTRMEEMWIKKIIGKSEKKRQLRGGPRHIWEDNVKIEIKEDGNGYGIAQSLYRRAMGWTIGVRFPSGAKYFCLLHSVQTGSEVLPACCPVDTRVFSRRQSVQGVKLTTHIHVLPRSRIVELYLRSPTRLYVVLLNKLCTGTILPLVFTEWL